MIQAPKVKPLRLVRANGRVEVIVIPPEQCSELFVHMITTCPSTSDVELSPPEYAPGKFKFDGEGLVFLHYKQVP